MTTVSIIICTRNRAESLGQTLRSIAGCTVPDDVTAELLVIDNGSTDQTPAVVTATKLSNILLRYVTEPKAGQCHARNSGLSHAEGTIILFTDDDVRPPIDWIQGMCRPILSGEADAVGGGVHFPDDYRNLFLTEPLRSRIGWFASTAGIDPDRPDRMVGANMAFHRRVADCLGGFDTALGPGALGFADETLFSRRLLDKGFRLVSAFGVSVEHHFDVKRIIPRQLVDLAERMGRSEGYLAHHWERRPPPVLKEVIRAKIGLTIRQLLRPSSWWHRSADEWEVRRVELLAFLEMRHALRNEPSKYWRTARHAADSLAALA